MRIIAVLTLIISTTFAVATDSCANATTPLTPAQKKMYARSIASWLATPHSPAQTAFKMNLDKPVRRSKPRSQGVDGCPTFPQAYSGFPVELSGAGGLHAAFLQ